MYRFGLLSCAHKGSQSASDGDCCHDWYQDQQRRYRQPNVLHCFRKREPPTSAPWISECNDLDQHIMVVDAKLPSAGKIERSAAVQLHEPKVRCDSRTLAPWRN